MLSLPLPSLLEKSPPARQWNNVWDGDNTSLPISFLDASILAWCCTRSPSIPPSFYLSSLFSSFSSTLFMSVCHTHAHIHAHTLLHKHTRTHVRTLSIVYLTCCKVHPPSVICKVESPATLSCSLAIVPPILTCSLPPAQIQLILHFPFHLQPILCPIPKHMQVFLSKYFHLSITCICRHTIL